ncbi:MAG: cysteine hydrolase family protein [Pseudomonadota bacterium]
MNIDTTSKPPALLLIDVQKAFDDPYWGKRNNPDAEKEMARLLTHWRQQRWPVVHIQHCSVDPNSPLQPGLPGHAFKDEVAPIDGEAQFQKTVNSGFIGTELEAHLKSRGLSDLVLVGLTTDHCVSTTTRMAGNLGFNVTLVSDATATFDRTGPDGVTHTAEALHQVHLASLHGEFCAVVTASELLSSLT